MRTNPTIRFSRRDDRPHDAVGILVCAFRAAGRHCAVGQERNGQAGCSDMASMPRDHTGIFCREAANTAFPRSFSSATCLPAISCHSYLSGIRKYSCRYCSLSICCFVYPLSRTASEVIRFRGSIILFIVATAMCALWQPHAGTMLSHPIFPWVMAWNFLLGWVAFFTLRDPHAPGLL